MKNFTRFALLCSTLSTLIAPQALAAGKNDQQGSCIKTDSAPTSQSLATIENLRSEHHLCLFESNVFPNALDLKGTKLGEADAPYTVWMESSAAGSYVYLETSTKTDAEIRARAKTLPGTFLGCEVDGDEKIRPDAVKDAECVLFSKDQQAFPDGTDLAGTGSAEPFAPYRVWSESADYGKFIHIASFKKGEADVRARAEKLGFNFLGCSTHTFQ